jgi:hypothetical protein
VSSFRLKPGLKFTPQDERYLVVDTDTQSKYRIGAAEYLILRQFEETTDVEEVAYKLQTEGRLNVSYETMYKFIQQALELELLRTVNDSWWTRLKPTEPFQFRVKLFDPNKILSRMITGWQRWNRLVIAAACILFMVAGIMAAVHFREIWHINLGHVQPFEIAITLLIYLSCIGHEMTHGLIAKFFGFEVAEVGFHLHYFLPSFYCKIFKPATASRSSLSAVLISGSLFDLVILSLLIIIWPLGVEGGLFREVVGFTITFMAVKVLVLQLNPLWPFSDGFRVAVLFFSKKEDYQWRPN